MGIAVIDEQDTAGRAQHAPPAEWIDVNREDLVNALARVKPAVGRSAIDAFTGVRVVSDEQGAHVWATDMRMVGWHTVALDGYSEGEFDALVSHAMLTRLLKALPKGIVRVEGVQDGGRMGLRLASGARTVELPGLDPEHFPAEPRVTFPPLRSVCEVPADMLRDALARALPHASVDESRPVLTGVLLDFAAGRLVATDSYRLCMVPFAFDADGAAANVPAVMLTAALRTLKDADTVVIAVHDDWVILDMGEAIWSARLIDGQFPSYERLIPDDFPAFVEVPGADLLDSIAACRAVLTADAPLRLAVHQGRPSRLIVTGQTPDGPSMTDEIRAEKATWPHDSDVEWGVNAEFLADTVRSVGGDVVRIEAITPLRPILVHDPHDEASAVCLNMPIRLNK